MSGNILERNHVKVYGQDPHRQKPVLIFAHGFGCDQSMWRLITPAFGDRYEIVLFDYVGAGKSDLTAYNPQRYSQLKGYAQDILDICEALNFTDTTAKGEIARDITLIGHSVSSMIGILASIQSPRLFRRLILVAPSPCYVNDQSGYVGGFERQDIEDLLALMERNYIGWASFIAPIVMQNPEYPNLTEELEARFCENDPAIAKQFARVTFLSDSRADLPKVTVPSLILQCADDAIAPLAVGKYIHQHIPQSSLKVMQATGHCPHLSHPQEVITLIKEYLDN